MGLFCGYRSSRSQFQYTHELSKQLNTMTHYNNMENMENMEDMEHFVMRIKFKTRDSLDILRLSCIKNIENRIDVEFCLFNEKKVKISNIQFLEWMLVNDLKHFFEMEDKDILGDTMLIEYGYYQGDRIKDEKLGCYKSFTDADFTEEMTFIILEYVRHMLMKI